MGKMRSVYKILVGNPEGKRPNYYWRIMMKLILKK
jgi:hypothetical protein